MHQTPKLLEMQERARGPLSEYQFFSVLSQEVGWEECLQSDLFCIEIKPKLSQHHTPQQHSYAVTLRIDPLCFHAGGY